MKYFIPLLLAMFFALPAQADQLADGMAATDRGDYVTAFKMWLPLAEKGDADAQDGVGFLYETGRGVQLDYAQAAKWYRAAADQGGWPAQTHLGSLYRSGRGVKKDDIEAYFWFSLAAKETRDAKVMFAQKSIGKFLTKKQRATVLKRVSDWKPVPHAAIP